MKPIYETVPGWSGDITGARSLDELPAAARDYVRMIEEAVSVPVSILSVGADRAETITLGDPWA